MKVAVTAVGGAVGQSIIKALQNTEYGVVGVNSEILGAGLYATRTSYLCPCADSPGYIDRMIEICRKEKCAVLFPGIDAELQPLSRNIQKLKASGITPIVSEPRVVSLCGDKLKTAIFLKNNGFPYPKTYKLEDYSFELDFPVVLKPRKGGHRSIGEYVARNPKEFDEYVAKVNVGNYVVQEYIEGDEYTCGTISLEDHCLGVILMKRELRAGDTYKAFVVKDNKLADFVERAINRLKPFGACNVQFRLKDDTPCILEFNARCSGTTASRALAGFNEPKIICDYLFKGIKNPHFKIKEIAILRYWKELVVSYEKIEAMKSEQSIQNRRVKL